MNKILKQVMLIGLSLSLVLCSVGCDGSKNSKTTKDGSKNLTIAFFDGGYGSSWIEKCAEQFEKDTDISVKLKPGVTDTGSWKTAIDAGRSDVDLYFSNNSNLDYVYNNGLNVNGKKYETYLAELTDMYNSKVPGEDILYKDKMLPAIRDALNIDLDYNYETRSYNENSKEGKYFTTNWSNSILSFVVNMEMWDDSWGNFPNTTDELIELCKKIIKLNEGKQVSERLYPFAYSLASSYWSYIFENWADQYLGKEGYNNYTNGYDKDGNRFTKELINNNAFLKSMEVLEECIKSRGKDGELSYSHPYSNTIDFTTAQFYLLNGKSLMQPNGDWLISEMSENYKNVDKLNIQFKRVPIISAIKDNCTTVESDGELSALVAAIDNGSSELKGSGYDVNQEDFDRIKYARTFCVSMANSQAAFIPAYSANIENAKLFLSYLASDEYLKIYYEETYGCMMPFSYDNVKSDYKASIFLTSEREIMDNSYVLPYSMGGLKNRFFACTGFNSMSLPYVFEHKAETALSAVNEADRKTAKEIINDNKNYLSKNWNSNYSAYSWD